MGTEDLGALALFDLTRICLLSLVKLVSFCFDLLSLTPMFFFQALVCIKALQDLCVAKEGVLTRVRKHNVNLMNEQGKYKEAIRTLNNKLKEVRGKLEEADCQKEKLQQEVTALSERVETAGTDAIQEFKASQSFINSCAEYYGTGFDDCLKQVACVFPELDLFGITMDNEGDGSPEFNPPPKDDSVVVLAQPATNPPPIPNSNPPTVLINVENQKDDGNPADAPAT